jgi:uncharacterized phosphosugar-binding protein
VTAVDRYFDDLFERLGNLRNRSGHAIETAAQACAASIAEGGVVHVFDTGHLVSHELIDRAGGLAAFVPFRIQLVVDDPHPVRDVDAAAAEGAVPKIVAAALASSRTQPGDVLVLGSVSGTASLPVELCRQARDRGLRTIAVTSVAYSSALAARHPSGLRLAEAADIVIDNGAPYGDATLGLDGVEHPCCPFSGVGAVTALWAVVARTVELLAADDRPPTVFASINLPDGPDLLEKARARYRDLGR